MQQIMNEFEKYFRPNASLENKSFSPLLNIKSSSLPRTFKNSLSYIKSNTKFEKTKLDTQEKEKDRSIYEQLKRFIREPIKNQLHSHQKKRKQKQKDSSFIRGKNYWKYQQESEQTLSKSKLIKSLKKQHKNELAQISKTIIPKKSKQNILKQRSLKYIKLEIKDQENKPVSSPIKPKKTILTRILNAKHMKQVILIIQHKTQHDVTANLNHSENISYLKPMNSSMNQMRGEQRTAIKPRSKPKNSEVQQKTSNLQINEKMTITGWSVEQCVE